MLAKKTILWVEDDNLNQERLLRRLECAGFTVLHARRAKTALDMLRKDKNIGLVILDVAIPDDGTFPEERTKKGFETGVLLGMRIREWFPALIVVGFSATGSTEIAEWFNDEAHGFFRKVLQESMLVDFVKRRLGTGHLRDRGPRVFFVHGHDNELLEQLRKSVKRLVKNCEIIVLRDLPGAGRTLIEKFEEESEHIDAVFVLLTPDDVGFPREAPERARSRARQNVIFELGYFYAKLQRTRGRITVLRKSDVEGPSDIAGVEYIDISNGLSSQTDKIRQVLSDWI